LHALVFIASHLLYIRWFCAQANSTVLCRFGTIGAPASYATDSSLVCISPANPPGFVALEISNNLQDFSLSGVLFLYLSVAIHFVHPHYASQLGGEEVSVHGENFLPPHESPLHCVFGASPPVLARWESSNVLKCEIQPTRHFGAVPVSIKSKGSLYKSTTTLVLLQRPRIDAIIPMRGPRRGGSHVRIRGRNFPTALTDRCYFGSIMTVPKFRSSGYYECTTPSAPSNGTVVVSINQDAQMSTHAMHFRFYEVWCLCGHSMFTLFKLILLCPALAGPGGCGFEAHKGSNRWRDICRNHRTKFRRTISIHNQGNLLLLQHNSGDCHVCDIDTAAMYCTETFGRLR
jgi:hypothetical protein